MRLKEEGEGGENCVDGDLDKVLLDAAGGADNHIDLGMVGRI